MAAGNTPCLVQWNVAGGAPTPQKTSSHFSNRLILLSLPLSVTPSSASSGAECKLQTDILSGEHLVGWSLDPFLQRKPTPPARLYNVMWGSITVADVGKITQLKMVTAQPICPEETPGEMRRF
ncbi:hypothetical protein SRHO_G00126430 [Serrasalmus rhombeus]